jgi:hypothetical protein
LAFITSETGAIRHHSDDRTETSVAIIEFQAEGGGTVLVQATSASGAAPVATRGGFNMAPSVERAQQSFARALDTIRTVSDSALEQIDTMSRRPDEMQVEFGLEFSAQAGTALLASANGTAHIQVTITWKAKSAAQGT